MRWCVVDGRLIRRGELLLSLDFLDAYDFELEALNGAAERIVEEVARRKQIDLFIESLSADEKRLLLRAVEDPDSLMCREGVKPIDRLVELNLVVDGLYSRNRFPLGIYSNHFI